MKNVKQYSATLPQLYIHSALQTHRQSTTNHQANPRPGPKNAIEVGSGTEAATPAGWPKPPLHAESSKLGAATL